MNDHQMTTIEYLPKMNDANVQPDAFTILLLGLFLERNITVVTANREWNLYPNKPADIVIGYNGGNRYLCTSLLAGDSSK